MFSLNKIKNGANIIKNINKFQLPNTKSKTLIINGKIINSKNIFKHLNSISNNINNSNNNNGSIRFYCSQNNQPERQRLRLPTFTRYMGFGNFTKDKGNWSSGNIFLNLLGMLIIITSSVSLVLYFFDSEDKSSQDEYIFRVLNYFSSTPPFELIDKKGYIKRLVEQYRDGTISPAGLKVIGSILALGGYEYLLKYDMFDIACEKLIARKDLVFARNDPDFFILYRLAFHTPKHVPNEIIQRTEKDNIFRLLEKKDQELSQLQPYKLEELLKIQKFDLLLTCLVGAPVISFLLFKNKVSPILLYKSMQRSAFISGLVVSAPLINDTMNKKLFKNCENFTCHAIKSSIPNLIYGSILFYCSYLPFITWGLPIACTLFLTKSYSLFKFMSQRPKSSSSSSSNNTIISDQ